MRLFLDSSALLKRYLMEPGRDTVMRRCAEADEIQLSFLAPVEAISAFNRLRRLASLSDEKYGALKAKLTTDVEHATVLKFAPSVAARATTCLESWPLRASDAIHVASALECGSDRFMSADHRQCVAARAAGLEVEEIAP